MKRILLLTGMCVFLLVSTSFAAAIPKLVNYQGMLGDSTGNPLTGTYSMIFRIYDDSTAGNLEWTETQAEIEVANGLFNVTLGAVTALNLAFDESYWLEVRVGNDTMPRMRFTSVGYAYRSVMADRAIVADSAVVAVAAGSTFDSLHVVGNAAIDGDLHMGGVITHDCPVQILDGLEFLDSSGTVVYHIEIDEAGEHPGTGMPDEMHGALGFESFADLNDNDMAVVFWDGVGDRPQFVLNSGGPQRASIFDRSLQVGKALGAAVVDSNYTKFEGFSYVDGLTSGTGADLGVEDDIEAKGSIYSQENLVAEGGEIIVGKGTTAYAGRLVLHDADAANSFTTTIASNADVAADYTMTLPGADGTAGQILFTDGSGNLTWNTGGDITSIGSMVSADAFADTSADDDWLGLGATAGRIEFDDQATDEVNILDAYVGIGTATPTAMLHIGGIDGSDGIRFPDGSLMLTANVGSANNLSNNTTIAITADADADGSGDIFIRTGPDYRMFIGNAGNVGVGTIIPDNKFSVSDVINPTQAIFGQEKTTGISQISIGNADVADSAFGIGYDHDNNYGFMQVTGDAVGSGLVVTDSGNVGIGTSDVDGSDGIPSKLAVETASQTSVRAFTAMAPNLLDGNSVYLALGVETSVNNSAWLSFQKNGAGSDNNNLTFGLYGVDNILALTGAGNAGIGTNSPDRRLSVTSDSSTQAIFGQDRTTGVSQISIGEEEADNLAFMIGFDHDSTSGYMQVAGDAIGSGLVIADGGNVGIGTPSPDASLHIGSSGDAVVHMVETTGNEAWISRYADRLHIASNDQIRFGTGGQSDPDVVIDSLGNVGIGTVQPDDKLHVTAGRIISGSNNFAKNAGAIGDIILDNGLTDTPGIHFYLADSTNYGINATDTGGLRFVENLSETGGVTRMHIDTLGNVGIGTEGAGESKLVIYGSDAFGSDDGGEIQLYMADDHDDAYNHWRIDVFEDDLRFGPTGQTHVTIDSTGIINILGVDGEAGIKFPDNTLLTSATVGSASNITSDGTALITADANADSTGDIHFYTGPNMRMSITNDGDIGIGTQTPTADLHVVGTVKLQDVNSGFVESDALGNLTTQKILTGTIHLGDIRGDYGGRPVSGDLLAAIKYDVGIGDVIDVIFTGFGDATYTVILTPEGTEAGRRYDNDMSLPLSYWKQDGIFRIFLEETAPVGQNVTMNVIIMDY